MSIGNVTAARADISEIIAKIKEFSTSSKVFNEHASIAPTQVQGSNGFDSIMNKIKGAVENVSDLQAQSDTIRDSYIVGDNNISLSQVLISSQKSKLAFEGLVTVRNKILESYKEIMNLQI